MQTMVPKSWRLCAIRLSACCAVLGFLPLRLVCATTVVIPKLFSTSYPSLLGRTHKPCCISRSCETVKAKRTDISCGFAREKRLFRQGEKESMTTIKAVRIHEFGDADVLQYEDVERPEPQAGE